ncbi:MAG: response regulator transcription factor [Alphaproteobacteria bacterium]|nr:response regulator transcription factor [Alphaproteobacteria bacterium]
MKILIADDHALFRDGLSLNIERLEPQAVIFQAGSFSQVMKILNDEKKFDLIIIDLDMPDMNWETALQDIMDKRGNARVAIISATEDVRIIRKAMEKGISGYIPKRADTKVLPGALKLIMDGGTYLPPSILENNGVNGINIASISRSRNGKTLTNRQSQVLELVAQGMSNKQIAYEIGVSEATVKLHINALLRAVGATNRTQAVITAQKMGLI